jgi:hypothetical protein
VSAKFWEGRAGARRRSLHAALVASLAITAVAAFPARALADPGSAARAREFTLALLSGSARPDQALSNYQWDTTPQLAYGLEALAHFSRASTGVRVLRTGTTQSLGIAGAPASTRVSETAVEWIGRVRLVSRGGVELSALASAGWLHLGYSPDRVSVASGPGTSVDVEFSPVDEWIGGGGLAMERRLAPRWSVGFELDHRVFALDTAHREGGAIVTGREAFGEWSARFALVRAFARR